MERLPDIHQKVKKLLELEIKVTSGAGQECSVKRGGKKNETPAPRATHREIGQDGCVRDVFFAGDSTDTRFLSEKTEKKGRGQGGPPSRVQLLLSKKKNGQGGKGGQKNNLGGGRKGGGTEKIILLKACFLGSRGWRGSVCGG